MESEYMQKRRAISQGLREPDPKKQPKPIAKMSEKKKAQIKSDNEFAFLDREFFLEVWHASDHVCQCGCKTKLPKEMQTVFMHHLLEKAIFPELRFVHANIMILAQQCHNAYHDNPNNRPEVKRRRQEAVKLLLKK